MVRVWGRAGLDENRKKRVWEAEREEDRVRVKEEYEVERAPLDGRLRPERRAALLQLKY